MKTGHFVTGLHKFWIYCRIIAHVPCHYAVRPHFFKSLSEYLRFLRRALQLLLVFRHNKIVRVSGGCKLHLYLPAYPSRAFFHAIESKLLRTPPGATTIVFSITKACDYRCSHCYQKKDKANELDEPRMIATALAARDSGVALFDIEGGEPFLKFGRLMSLVHALDPRSEIWVNTTGAHLKSGMLEELKQSGLFGLMVSIHSPDRDTHDAFTGVHGSFDTACRVIRECRHLDLAAAMNTVLSQGEIERGELDRLMELASIMDCDYVQLIHPKPAGDWLDRKDDMQTDRSLINAIRQSHLLYNSRARHSYPSLAAQVFEESEGVLGCTAGAVDRYYIGAGGEVQPCEFLNISFGNVNEEPFSRIYARMRSYFRTPSCDWICCTQADDISRLIRKHNLQHMPLPWKVTRELVETWNRGKPTPIYKRLGIYE